MSTVDELTVDYEEDGKLLTKQLDKVVLSKGAWTTIIYRYQQWEPNKDAYSADKFTIRRYQKRNDQYMQRSKFNISSRDQAEKIIDALQHWLSDSTNEDNDTN